MNVTSKNYSDQGCFLDGLCRRATDLWTALPLLEKVACVVLGLLLGAAVITTIVVGVGPDKIAHFLSKPVAISGMIITGEACLALGVIWKGIADLKKPTQEIAEEVVEKENVYTCAGREPTTSTVMSLAGGETINILETENCFDNFEYFFGPPNLPGKSVSDEA